MVATSLDLHQGWRPCGGYHRGMMTISDLRNRSRGLGAAVSRGACKGIAILGLAFGLAAAPIADAAAQTRPWEISLRLQLLEDHACTLAYFTNVEEREYDDQTIIVARAHCNDRRAFDVRREHADQPFKVEPCPTVC